MQDTLLRVFLVGLGLLMCPRDDPGVEEVLEDMVVVGMQNFEELPRNQDLDQEMVHGDESGPLNNLITKEEAQSDQNFTDKRKTSVSEEGNSHEDYARDRLSEREHSAPSQPQKSRSKPENSPNTLPTDREQKGNLQLDMRIEQGGNSQTEPIRPQGQQDKPEETEAYSSKEVHMKTAIGNWEVNYLWYIWNTFSIISTIHFLRKYFSKNSQMKQGELKTLFPGSCIAAEVSLPDNETLQSFYSKCVQAPHKRSEEEFLEGFANHMVETMRTICDRDGSMEIEDCQMLDGCNIIVPFILPEPYSFQYLLKINQVPDMPIYGQIKVMENKIQNSCPCQSSDADILCLQHCENETVMAECTEVCNDFLCLKDTPFLSKSQVTRWFQSTIKQAWEEISYKYEFVLHIHAPGALVVQFRSGKKLSFSMNPVVKFNTDAHFYISPCSPNKLDIFWMLSLSSYEEQLLKHLSEHLPENSCHIPTLEIAHFLHKRQTALSGFSALKDCHFKTALLHLLLTKDPSHWKPDYVACRLRDLLDFMKRSLEKKCLHHVLIGNPLTQNIIHLPTELNQAEPVNLFQPLVVEDCIYRHAVMHFQEMLRNAHMLIHDYVKR